MTINESRPVEDLVGVNRGIVRQRLANLHVGNSVWRAARHARPKGMRRVPIALRRGWVKCVLETWKEYRDTYALVMGVRF